MLSRRTILQLLDEGEFEAPREFLTKGVKTPPSEGRKGEDKWIPLEPSHKNILLRDIYLHGIQKGDEGIVTFAKECGAQVNNDYLLAVVIRRDEMLFKHLVFQMEEGKIEWKKIVTELLLDGDSLHFFQFLVDNYLGKKWEELIPEEADMRGDTCAYIRLLRRLEKSKQC